MSDAEKEMYVESLKRQVRNRYKQDVADDLCRRLEMCQRCRMEMQWIAVKSE